MPSFDSIDNAKSGTEVVSLHYLLITLRNTTRTIIPRGAIDYDNSVAVNKEEIETTG